MWQMVCDTLAPFWWGLALALVLELPLRWLEQRLTRLALPWRRAVSLGCILVVLVGGAALAGWLLVPPLWRTVQPLLVQGKTMAGPFLAGLGPAGQALVQRLTQPDTLRPLLQTGVALAHTAAQTLAQLGLGLVLALYLLASRETTLVRVRRFCLALWGEEKTARIQQVARRAARVFGSFVVGQCVESLILTGLFLAVLLPLGFPYGVPISVVIGVTALLPVFGAWLGGAAGFVLTLAAGGGKAVQFLVVFCLLQQLENQLIYPRVVGRRVGLPALWVLAGVVLGGGVLGPVGLFLGIPLLGVVYDLTRGWVHFRLDKPEKM